MAPVIVCLVGAALPATADEPLYVKNLSPVTGLLGLPPQRSADSEKKGELAAALHSSVSNIYVLDANSHEYLNLDGETLRLRWICATAWRPTWMYNSKCRG